MYLNDFEDMHMKNGLNGIDINMFKIFLILYADDIVLFENTSIEFQASLDLILEYCQKWKLKVNTEKTKNFVEKVVG